MGLNRPVIGTPPPEPDEWPEDDPRRHNCDAMGCSSVEHVLRWEPIADAMSDQQGQRGDMTAQRKEELLPCPFCGGQAEKAGDAVSCSECYVGWRTHQEDETEKWNRRALLRAEQSPGACRSCGKPRAPKGDFVLMEEMSRYCWGRCTDGRLSATAEQPHGATGEGAVAVKNGGLDPNHENRQGQSNDRARSEGMAASKPSLGDGQGDHAADAAMHGSRPQESRRRLDGKFHVQGSEIVKTSSGEIIPHDEPLWLVRGRDYLAVAAIEHYETLCRLDGCNDFQLEGIRGAVEEFKRFAAEHADRMKQPGITRGKPWTGEQPDPNRARGVAPPAVEQAAGVPAREITMHEKQRRSFAYGNANLSNPEVTREVVDKVADDQAAGGEGRVREVVEAAREILDGLRVYDYHDGRGVTQVCARQQTRLRAALAALEATE